MAARKYWLQLPQTYFTRLPQRKMRKQPDGEIMQIIYLKLLLACIGNSGLILYQGVYDSLAEEIAEEIDEDSQIVQKTIDYILKNNMARTIDDEEGGGYFFPESDEFTGSESESAERMRRMREKAKASQCDANVTGCDNGVTDGDDNKVKNKKENVKKNIIDSSLHFTKEGDAHPPSAGAGGAHTFTLTDVQQCVEDNDIDLSDKGITAFYKWMEKYDWKINKRKVTKLENALSGYARKHPEYSLAQEEPEEPEPVTPSKYLETFKTWLRYHDYADGGEGDFSEEISISDEVIDTIFEVEDMNEPVSQINDRLCDQFGEKEVSPFMELFRKWAKEKKYDNLRRRNGKE